MRDFESFLQSGHAQVPAESLDRLKKEVFPRLSQVAFKIGLIHLLSSFVSLMLCPQFGLRLFFEGHGLMHFFMEAGSVGCYALCGAFYLGTTFWLAKIFLGEFEWALLRRKSALIMGSLALLSLGAFAMFSHELSFEVGFVWLLGAIVSSAVPLLSPIHHRPIIKST